MSDSARRTARTVLAVVLALAAGLPLLVRTAGLPDTLPGLGTVLAVAAAITRVMALPQVDTWMPGWLRMSPPQLPLPDPAVPPAPLIPPNGSRE
ncbi:hypothetical protein [Kitasatospora cathayae]|uniref:Uncharacterized protein n=1 Tax=Kitasatospora cathayae TaxID=3004092 RepID=A0ABY7QA47_9ACTN|nr:hypothetical protein [Kitasatospora sp. HUAS 3-15]WBP89547.1 hypothetical protein O1G21_29360 [Kitasatospora sp. HUAS 3-15]